MRMKWLLFGVLGCILSCKLLDAIRANPCCKIFALNETQIPSIYDINWIYITEPHTCGGFSIAQVLQRRSAQHQSTLYVCSNGFNVISFLLAVLKKLPLNAEEQNLRNHLITLQNSFLSKLSTVTTGEQRFNRQHGQMVTT
ncbi:orf 47 [Ateline gammaherpesvirus 3]|uniref:Orf 47 n=1 Tax=Ateline herpesvirus 3 TaxID=85618 RepID=Q9YTL8_ATHV3|nr:orf 47 [Ateline gammaherpesvirus 3]AAC95572.1 orf 47 [Ateline gammaherpesvirus 3]